MARIDPIARAALAGDALALRSAVQGWLANHPDLTEMPPPESPDPNLRAVAAARTVRRLRRPCDVEASPPLRRRNLFAPPTFLKSA